MENKRPTKDRMKMMHHGEVFNGLHKVKNKAERRVLEAKRHNKFMDLLGSGPAVESGLPKNPNPVEWVKAYVVHKGVKKTKKDIIEILKTFRTDDNMASPYVNSKQAAKNKTFYINALAYLKKNMVK